jgi:hypothetical protein
MKILEIDLHPEKTKTEYKSQVLVMCRQFLKRCIEAGASQCRVITGHGLRSDGYRGRLRSAVEDEVLPLFYNHIKEVVIEQQGAVLRIYFKKSSKPPNALWLKRWQQQQEKNQNIKEKEQQKLTRDRLEQALDYYDENDLRRCRLKVNQILKSLELPPVENQIDKKKLRESLFKVLKELG